MNKKLPDHRIIPGAHEEASARVVTIVAWALVALTLVLGVVAWSQQRLADGELGRYELYPLLGLIAFSLMWTHYVVGAVRRWFGVRKQVLRAYSFVTSWLVLACLLLHPALLAYELWHDGLGLPPFSIVSVYASGLMPIAIITGSVSLTAFLAYELHRWFRDASWWKYVEIASIAAMIAIFWHGLQLGGEVSGWYLAIWVMYAITFVAAIVYNHNYDKGTRREA